MSDASASRAYLRSCFGHDPGTEPGRIFELRRQHRSGSTEDTSPARGPLRTQIEAHLRQLHNRFYTQTPGELREALAEIDAQAHPDLERHLNRLRRVADVREDILLASNDEQIDEEFMNLFRRCAIARRRDAVRLQTECLEGMGSKASHRNCTAAAKRIEEHYPALRRLMPGWFEQIRAKPKPSLGDRRTSHSALGCLGIYLIVRLVVTILKSLLGEDPT